MPVDVIMPALGPGARHGEGRVRWLKAAGDHVRVGDPLVEVETYWVTSRIRSRTHLSF